MRSHCIHVVLLVLLGACAAVGPSTAPVGKGTKLLGLDQTVRREGRVDFAGNLPDYRWAEDGEHLVLEEGEETVWIDPATWAQSTPPEEEESTDELWKLFAAVDGVDEERAKEIAEADAQTGTNEGELRESEGELWFTRDGKARLLAESGDAEIELADLSPDGERIGFVQGNDLSVIDTAAGERRALSDDGGVNVFNGKLDWVYQEEIYGRGDFKAFWWSPDSKHVAFLRLDETEVHEFTVVDHIVEGHFRVKPEITKYPKAGDPNPTVRLGVADATAAGPGDVRWVDLSGYEGTEPLVVRVDWTPSGNGLVYMVQDRIQTWLDLCIASPADATSRTLLREESTAWTYRPPPPRWLEDGTFLWMSDRTGQRHVHRYRASGEHVGAVTAGDWSVGAIDEVDEEAGVMWFSSTKDGAVNANTYRIRLDGTGLTRLTQGDGRHSVSWNEARTLFLDRHSSLERRPSLKLCNAEGKALRELGTADIPALDEYLASPWELHRIRARDGWELDVALLKPVPFDPSASYPVWIPTYSGPNAPSVRNAWNGSAWYQFLAQNGVVVMQVNVRSASGKGPASTKTAYLRLGVQELRDLEDAVDWVTANRWADAERVGITGSSYGGFMTAYALTHSKKFAVGVAGSGVYDWGMYDTIYTERFMSTPQLNPEGYAETSVITAAADLNGHLVLTHGVMDDNVHLQNTVQLIYELQKAGKDFELMLFPQSRHGIRDRDQRWSLRRLEWRTIREHLLGNQARN